MRTPSLAPTSQEAQDAVLGLQSLKSMPRGNVSPNTLGQDICEVFPHTWTLTAACSLPTGSGLLEGEQSFPHSQTAAQMVAYTLRSAPSEAQCFMGSQL